MSGQVRNAEDDIVILERTGRWAAALQRDTGVNDLRIGQSRSIPETLDRIRDDPAGVLAVHYGAGKVEDLVRMLFCTHLDYPHVAAVLLSDGPAGEWGWLGRTAGAVHVIESIRDASVLARLVRRQLKTSPRTECPLERRVWKLLPW